MGHGFHSKLAEYGSKTKAQNQLTFELRMSNLSGWLSTYHIRLNIMCTYIYIYITYIYIYYVCIYIYYVYIYIMYILYIHYVYIYIHNIYIYI